ncbi:DUF4179 domain-containing protein [Intestinibacter sp.]
MKKIHEMLNNIDEDKYLDDEKILLNDEKDRIFNMTMDKIKNSSDDSKKYSKRISSKKIITVILASVLMISTLSFAADYFSFDVRLQNLLSINDENYNLINNSGANLNKSVKSNGVAVTATQLIGDKNSLYVLLKVTTDKKFEQPVKMFEEGTFEVKSKNNYIPCTSSSFQHVSDDDNDTQTSTFLATIEQEDISKGDIRLTFENFGYLPYDSDKDEYESFVKLIDGKWTLELELNYKDTSNTYIINKTYNLKNSKVRVKTITISPLSVRIKSNGKYNKFISKVTMKDKTEYSGDFFITNTSSYSTIGRDLFGRSESYASFSKVLNPKDIKSITINDEIEVVLP